MTASDQPRPEGPQRPPPRSAVVAVAFVTGGTRCLGRAAVDLLVERGFAVLVVYLHDQRAADAVIEEVLEDGGTAVAIRADVTDDVDVERAFDEAQAAFGGVDVVVHAARVGDAVVLVHARRRLRPGGIVVAVTAPADLARVAARVERWQRFGA